jgi:hypothetical protein
MSSGSGLARPVIAYREQDDIAAEHADGDCEAWLADGRAGVRKLLSRVLLWRFSAWRWASSMLRHRGSSRCRWVGVWLVGRLSQLIEHTACISA